VKTTRKPESRQDPSISQEPADVVSKGVIMVTGQAPPHILQEALKLVSSSERVRSIMITSLIGQARSEGFDCEEEICKAADYKNAGEYWQVKISEPMKALSFAIVLAKHLLDPTERLGFSHVTVDRCVGCRRPFDAISAGFGVTPGTSRELLKTEPPFDSRTGVRTLVENALRSALEANEPWFIKDPVPLLRDAVRADLERLKLDPCAATKWLLSKPKRRDLVPPGLRAFLEASERPGDEGVDAVYSTGCAGRPTLKHLCEAEMRRRADTGDLLSTLNAECKYLVEQWLPVAHPKAAVVKAKSIMNSLRHVYKELKKA
jgi:hypothetical protein